MADDATELLDSDLIRSVLDGFSDPAFLLDRDHRIRQVNAAWLRRFSGGPAVVGRHCHEVLHQEPVACDAAGHDCPLVDCAARERSVHCLHVHAGPEHPEHHHVSVHPVRVHGGDLVGFLQTFHLLRASSAGGTPIEIAPEARELLAGWRYPGNVAELLGLLERAVLIADGTTLSPEHLRDARAPCASLPEVPRPCGEVLPLAEVERRYLLWAL